MKKTIYILFVILVCCCLPVQAYEYFTINFTDGTKSDAFYATDVESISYSKLDLDGMEHSDWQVQEIQTSDSLYRIPLKDIAYLDFKDVDENKVAEDIANASEFIIPLFAKCKSPIELCNYISTIRDVDGIDDAYVEGQTLFVKIKDWGYISFYYPIDDLETYEGLELSPASSAPHKAMTLSRVSDPNEHHHVEALKACVINQQFYDEKRKSFKEIANQFCVSFANMGIETRTINMPSLDFFQNNMFDYDILFIKTHGDYDKKTDLHWLCTGEELWSYNPNEIIVGDIGKLINVKIPLWLKHGYSPKKVSFMCVKEKRDGENLHIFYTTISDDFIRSAKKQFRNPGSAIVFNTACESMMYNNKMAKAFESKGAGCYFGYDDTNSIGGTAGKNLFAHLLVGKSTLSAYKAIPEWCKEQLIYEDEEGCVYDAPPSGKYNKYNPKLESYPLTQSLCIIHPETLSAEEELDVEKAIKIKGCMKRANITGAFVNSSVGFQWSKNLDMSQPDCAEVVSNYDPATLYMSWEKTLDESELEPNTTYYYRAYMNDGYSNCYGDVRSFTTQPPVNAEPYIVYCDGIATFYYDDKKLERLYDQIESISWIRGNNVVNKVIFDSSFRNYLPVELSFYRCTNLKTIENLCYLNTSNMMYMGAMFEDCSSLTSLDLSSFDTSNVIDMEVMFCGCSSLTSLDLSGFNTSNVTYYMAGMFSDCSSLTSLDVSSFDTSNVTDMGDMFCGCSSLTSLDLSSFNTSNVTRMCGMFGYCSSLTSLDLSNFNTSNVTDMRSMFFGCSSLTSLNLSGFDASSSLECMFYGCSSLTSLDLSSFNTSNVTSMTSMFSNCTSLRSLDLSNFNTSNVTSMDSMFSGCSSLTSLDVSHFNTSNMIYVSYMFSGCSSLTSLDLSSFSTSKLRNSENMFRNCHSLRTIYAGNWKSYAGGMFSGCENLTGGKGTKIGKNLYGYDQNGNPLYYECPNDGRAAHIDGGKDNPGLFTAK